MTPDTLHISERMVLGAIMVDNAQLARVNLSAGDFREGSHGQIFDCLRRMIGAGKAMDAVTLADELERESPQTKGHWLVLLATLMRECMAPGNASAYAAAVRKAARGRRAALIGQRLVEGGDEAVADAIRELIELTSAAREHMCHVSDAIQGALAQLEATIDGVAPGVPMGIRDLDDALGGMHDEDLIVIAARPAAGKTAIMLNIAAAAANRGVGIVSGEQGRDQVGMRILAIEGPVSLHRMRTGVLHDEEWTRVGKVCSAMKGKPIWIFDKPAPTIDEIVAQARAWKFHQGIGVLMIDYLQKIRGGRGQDFRLQVGDIATQLKDLGRELKIPVVALAQVKREVESRPMGGDGLGRMPYMGDIAEAAIIEQEADQIITLYRPEVYDDSPQYRGIAYANICKNRHGPTGHKALSWRGEYLKFGDLAKQEMQQDRWSGSAA